MKNVIAGLTLAIVAMFSGAARADGAIICKSDSTGACAGRQYCCYAGGESDGDKYCRNLGCSRGGTSSCPTAANVNSCGTRDHKLRNNRAAQSMSTDDAVLMSVQP